MTQLKTKPDVSIGDFHHLYSVNENPKTVRVIAIDGNAARAVNIHDATEVVTFPIGHVVLDSDNVIGK